MRGSVDIQTLTFRAARSTGQMKCAWWNSVVFFFLFLMCLVKHVVEKCSIVCSCACKGSRFSLCRHGMPIHIQSVTIKIFYHDLLLLHVLGGKTQQIAKFQLVTQQIINWNQSLLFQAQIFNFMRTHLSLKSKDSRMSARLASLRASRQWFDPSFCYCRLLYMTTCFGPVSFPSLRMILVSEPAGSLHPLFGKRGEEGRREQEQMHVKRKWGLENGARRDRYLVDRGGIYLTRIRCSHLISLPVIWRRGGLCCKMLLCGLSAPSAPPKRFSHTAPKGYTAESRAHSV